jgi:mRNA interferase MazF
MTTSGSERSWRPACRFQRREGFIVLDQLRTIDRNRVVRRLGRLAPATLSMALSRLQEMFSA